jgi:3-hydroxyacyl-CoA dehydrogenase
MQLMDEITLDTNINVLNAVTPLISNGVALSTPVERATKQHPGMHHEHVMGVFMMMDFTAILI